MTTTIVHLLRHGEVHNPRGILYGRMPGYRLSPAGEQMARDVADFLSGARDDEPRHDVRLVVASPLLRARQTAAPIAGAFDLPVDVDARLLEAANAFEGRVVDARMLLRPENLRRLYNPLRPSWGEAYRSQVARMTAAVRAARDRAAGHEAVLVSHQLPIWVTHLAVTGRPMPHLPTRRRCALASLTSLRFEDRTFVGLEYREPAAGPGPTLEVPAPGR